MKKRLLLLLISIISYAGNAQDTSSVNEDYCQKEIQTGLLLLTGSDEIVQDVSKGMELLLRLVNEGCKDAQTIFGTTETNSDATVASLNEISENIPEEEIESDKLIEEEITQVEVDLPNENEMSSEVPESNTLENNQEENIALAEIPTELESCQSETYMGRMLLTGNDVVLQDIPKGIELLNQLGDDGCAEAQLRLGLTYKTDAFINADENKAYEYIQKAADQGLPRAFAELGMLHQLGIGCPINYEEALRLYEKAYDLGDGMGAYSIGYCHFKGLGSVAQSYTKAIEWFSKSDYPMAQHWLAIFNYFGYGMPVNKDAAYELLLTNSGIVNSPTLLAHLESAKDEATGILSDYQDMNVAQETRQINTLLDTDTDATEITKDTTVLTAEKLAGSWSGKLVEIEWSGERILRDFPVSFKVSADEDTGGVNYHASINGNEHSDLAILLDESLYFQNFEIALPRLYKDNPNVDTLNYSILNADFQIKTIDYLRFLVGYVDTKINNWGEPGPPMLLVLANDKILTENGIEISKELLEALLAEQGDNFINLYPNPFQDDLLIQFELAQESDTTVEIYSLDGMFSHIIASNFKQQAGKQLFQYNGNNLPAGLYVVRVTAQGVVHTKLIIKE